LKEKRKTLYNTLLKNHFSRLINFNKLRKNNIVKKNILTKKSNDYSINRLSKKIITLFK
jgi:hypothetical protein